MNVSPPSYLDDHILVAVDIKEGAHLFLLKALAVWHARHGDLLDYGFEKSNKGAREGLGWAVFNPELTSAALDELHLVFDPFFTPTPVLWEYVPSAYNSL